MIRTREVKSLLSLYYDCITSHFYIYLKKSVFTKNNFEFFANILDFRLFINVYVLVNFTKACINFYLFFFQKKKKKNFYMF